MKKNLVSESSLIPPSFSLSLSLETFPFLVKRKKGKEKEKFHDPFMTRTCTICSPRSVSFFRARWIVFRVDKKKAEREGRKKESSLSKFRVRIKISLHFEASGNLWNGSNEFRGEHIKMAIASVPVATLAEVSAAIDSGDISRGTIASDDVDNSRSEANESVNWTTSSGPPISGPLHGASLFSLSV